MAKIGMYAGTFDPVHQGHIAFALVAAKHAQLHRVIFLPERRPRYKTDVTEFNDRLAMLTLAASDHRELEVLALPEGQFTVAKTLPQLQKQYGKQLVLLIGSDVVSSLPRWEGLEILLANMELLVALRQGDAETSVADQLRKLSATFTCIPSPHQFLASSRIRQQAIGDSLHPDVQAYITDNRLYSLANKSYT